MGKKLLYDRLAVWDIISNVDQSVAWETNVCQRGRPPPSHALNPIRIDTVHKKNGKSDNFPHFLPLRLFFPFLWLLLGQERPGPSHQIGQAAHIPEAAQA